ncbi:MAG: hypothetical protein IT256_08075 [Chitinophagaceae bacterium]|nr:hypothetical protein [Chitinophagaceae bacterium]
MTEWIMFVIKFMSKKTIKLYNRILVVFGIVAVICIIDYSVHLSEFIFTNYKVSTIKSLINLRNQNRDDTLLFLKLNNDINYYTTLDHPYNVIKPTANLLKIKEELNGVDSENINFFSFWTIFSSVGVFYSLFILSLIFIKDVDKSLKNIIAMTILSFICFCLINWLPNLSCGFYGRVISNFIYQTIGSLIYVLIIIIYVVTLQDEGFRKTKINF